MLRSLFKKDRRDLDLPSFLFFKPRQSEEQKELDPGYFSVDASWMWENVSNSSYRLS